MTGHLKTLVRRWVERSGYQIRRIPTQLGHDEVRDLVRLVGPLDAANPPVIFDVGAHLGQSVQKYSSVFPSATIFAFEPSQSTFEQLEANVAGIPNVRLNNLALGDQPGRLTLLRHSSTDMNSMLAPDLDCWTDPQGEESVEVCTLDEYCRAKRVESIDVLKSDTQGFDLHVLRGAEQMLRAQAIRLIYVEVSFARMYQGQAEFDEVLGYMRGRGYGLVGLYHPWYQHDQLAWADALFSPTVRKAANVRPVWSH